MDAEDFSAPEVQLLIQNLRQYRAVSVAQLLAAEGQSSVSDAQGSETAAPGDSREKGFANLSADVAADVEFESGDRAPDTAMPMSSVGVPARLGPAAAIAPGKSKNAAVLVPLFRTPEGELRVWLTKRATKLSTHAGLII